jgi:putative membrane protein
MVSLTLEKCRFSAQLITRERTCVLLFVPVAECHVESIADQGINNRVASEAWQASLTGIILRFRQRQVADGFLAAIAACDITLSIRFPATDDNRNELPNCLVELQSLPGKDISARLPLLYAAYAT